MEGGVVAGTATILLRFNELVTLEVTDTVLLPIAAIKLSYTSSSNPEYLYLKVSPLFQVIVAACQFSSSEMTVLLAVAIVTVLVKLVLGVAPFVEELLPLTLETPE